MRFQVYLHAYSGTVPWIVSIGLCYALYCNFVQYLGEFKDNRNRLCSLHCKFWEICLLGTKAPSTNSSKIPKACTTPMKTTKSQLLGSLWCRVLSNSRRSFTGICTIKLPGSWPQKCSEVLLPTKSSLSHGRSSSRTISNHAACTIN